MLNEQLELGAFASLSFGVVGDAMGTPTENLEPSQIDAKFGWVETLDGDGTIACMAGYVCGALSRDEAKVTAALESLPQNIAEREKALAKKLIATARQKARSEVQN